MTDPTDIWIAFDEEHRPPRAWKMAGASASGSPVAVDGLEQACALAPECPVLTAADAKTDATALPASPSTLKIIQSGRVHTVAALSQTRPHARLAGAANRIAGFLSLNKDWDGVICLPGFDTTVWALISADEVVSVLAFATVPLVEALSPVDIHQTMPDANALSDHLQDVTSKPENLALRTAETRLLWATDTLSDGAALGQIWGAALGAELAASRAYWLGQNLALIAPAPLAAPYKKALEGQFVPVTETDEARMTLAGYISAYQRLRAAPDA